MTNSLPPYHDVLARLDAAEQELARLHAACAPRPARRRRPGALRRLVPLTLVALLVTLVPLSLAAAGFTDLVSNSPHNDDITAIYTAGITKGCVPGVAYCPTANVTRQEMASFLARTAGLGGNPPVANALTAVNAQTAVNAASATNATNATNAANANTVGGYAPNGLLRVARGSNDPGTSPTLTTAAYMPIASATIAVPGPGFVLVTGAGSLADFSTSPRALVLTRLRDTAPGGEVSPTRLANGANFSVATSWVFPVSAAGTKTYVVEASLVVAGNGATVALDGQLTALYVPFGSVGGSALGGE